MNMYKILNIICIMAISAGNNTAPVSMPSNTLSTLSRADQDKIFTLNTILNQFENHINAMYVNFDQFTKTKLNNAKYSKDDKKKEVKKDSASRYNQALFNLYKSFTALKNAIASNDLSTVSTLIEDLRLNAWSMPALSEIIQEGWELKHLLKFGLTSDYRANNLHIYAPAFTKALSQLKTSLETVK